MNKNFSTIAAKYKVQLSFADGLGLAGDPGYTVDVRHDPVDGSLIVLRNSEIFAELLNDEGKSLGVGTSLVITRID